MDPSVLTGSLGVGILLVAFVLLLLRFLKSDSFTYSFLNFSGALLAGIASLMIDYIPFVVLEGAWALTALAGMVKALWKVKKEIPTK